MQKVRKLLCLLLCAAMLMSMSAVCFAANNKYSSWFKTNYDEINQLGLMPASFNGLDLTKDITRGEMCELAVYAFEKATGNDIDLSNENFTGFTDTNDENIVKAHLYGIVNGYEDGSFRPNQLLTPAGVFQADRELLHRGGLLPHGCGRRAERLCRRKQDLFLGEGIRADLRELLLCAGHEARQWHLSEPQGQHQPAGSDDDVPALLQDHPVVLR